MSIGEEAHVQNLMQRLAEAEATIEALLSGQIDAVVDSTTKTPLLLAKAQRALRESENCLRRERDRAQQYLSMAEDILRALAEDEPNTQPLRASDDFGSIEARLRSAATAIREYQRELNQAKLKAESATAAKSEFLATMSHEIRTPMNIIMGATDLISETNLSAEQAEYIRLLRKSSETLLTLINDILDLSKIEAGQVSLENVAFQLDQVVDRTAESLALRAHQKGLELAVYISAGTPMNLIGDPTRLRQVLLNLGSNAIKFTPAGEVILHVESDHGRADCVALTFAVSDTGIGIPEEKLEVIFDRFTQADSSTTRHYGGSGLGLAICKRLVELMGGTLESHSRVGQGSKFSFSIPLRIAAQPTSQESTVQGELEGLRVLVVDDNATSRFIIGKAMAEVGVVSAEAPDGPGALAEIRRAHEAGERYNVLLLDCQMPGMGGLEVMRRLAEDSGLYVPTVLMVTWDDQVGLFERCRSARIDVSLIKPVRKAALIEAISKAIGTNRPSEVEAAQAAPPKSVRRRRVLLADDCEDNVFLVRAYIGASHELDVAENGAVAVEKFKTGRYDIVLMDIQMPVMDGYTATRQIRMWEESRGRKPVPIVSLTAHSLKEEEIKSVEAGCNAHLSKPVSKSALLDAIAEYALRSEGVPEVPEEIRGRAPAFIARQRRQLESLASSGEPRDYAALRKYAHNLKGTGRGYGYPELSELARSLEDAAKAEDPRNVRKHMTALNAFLKEIA